MKASEHARGLPLRVSEEASFFEFHVSVWLLFGLKALSKTLIAE